MDNGQWTMVNGHWTMDNGEYGIIVVYLRQEQIRKIVTGFPLRPLRCFPLRTLREKIKY